MVQEFLQNRGCSGVRLEPQCKMISFGTLGSQMSKLYKPTFFKKIAEEVFRSILQKKLTKNQNLFAF
jgi:hypothetical protein